MFDLHRHDEFSTFDGFGKAPELAKLAKELGHSALCTTNHGNTCGLIRTYQACQREGIKAILGVEGYFLPKHKEQTRGYHMILLAKNLKGYENINRIQFEGEKQKYYNPIWTLELLEKYHEGLICTTACVASYFSQCIVKDKDDQAAKFLRRLKKIFGDDLYVEIQPYAISEEGLQEKVNVHSIKIAKQVGVKCVLTSDSHRGRKEDLDTYLKMHQIAGHDGMDIEATYADRYMPTAKEIWQRFVKMHCDDFPNVKALGEEMLRNLDEIDVKCEDGYLAKLPLKLPKLVSAGGLSSYDVLVQKVKDGLKKRGKYNKQYINRCKEELKVIKYHGFEDYFLIVADYTVWAKDHGICVGPGRGSVCNCLVAYALYITEVDSIHFGLDFRRFMRIDKTAYPDIDLDFEMDRRQEVIDYLIEKYKGHSARVSSYGLYKVDNLLNDLAKVCGLETTGDIDESVKQSHKEEIARIKKMLNSCKADDGSVDLEKLQNNHHEYVTYLNKTYDGIIRHFIALFGKVRFIGTHSAAVAITDGDILQYTSLRMDKAGNIYSPYNLDDLNDINIIKFDLLGLKTMQSISECRKLAGLDSFDIRYTEDPELLEQFRTGNTSGIFQFEKDTVKNILSEIDCNCFNDVVAACAMNRPGPLSQGMPEMYAQCKREGAMRNSVVYEYTQESYGTVVYQEQLLLICVYIGGLDWTEADVVLKANKHGSRANTILRLNEYKAKTGVDLHEKFVSNASQNGLDETEAEEAWESLLVYSFNKGHAAGYCIIAMEEMFYKYYYPTIFWYAKIKYARDDREKEMYCCDAVKSGAVVFLPHVNYADIATSMRKVEGEDVLQKGLSDLKGVGEKAAAAIVEERKKNGIFVNFDDFYDRCKSRVVTSRVIDILKEQGALEFNKKTYIKRVTKYNSALYSRAK